MSDNNDNQNNNAGQNQPPHPNLQRQEGEAQNQTEHEIVGRESQSVEQAIEENPHKPSAWKANIQLLIVLGFIIGGFVLSQSLQVEEERQQQETEIRDLLVETKLISPVTKKIEFTRTGNISVNGQINIVPQVSGRIVNVNPGFNNGGVFESNQTLFSIEQADFVNAVNIAKSQVEQARTALKIQQAESEASLAEWNSINPNLPPPALVAKKPQLQQAQANLTAARAQLADANLALKRTKFKYDFAGRIIDTTIEEGQFVQAGQSYGQAYPRNALEVIVPVEDKILQYMDVQNSNVIIRTKYRGEEITLEGQVDRVGSVLNPNTRFVDVVIKPKADNWDILIPGVFVEVDLIGKSVENVWVLPNESLQGQSDIWIVNAENKLEKFKPQIITTNDETTDAIGNGQNIQVIMGLLKGASSGMTVRIADKDKNQQMGSAPPNDNAEPLTQQNTPPITSPIEDNQQ